MAYFFDNVYELWSDDHRQITILVDPGRVKTGLKENLKRGRAFIAGLRVQTQHINQLAVTTG